MSRRGQQHQRTAITGTPSLRGRLPGVLGLLLGSAFTLVAAWQGYTLWYQLPAPSTARIDWESFRKNQALLSGDARTGWLHAIVSANATRCLRNPAFLADVIADTRAGQRAIPDSGFLRIQLAALRMWNFERAGVAPDLWWPRVQRDLRDIDPATLRHHTEPLLQAIAGLLTRNNIGPGTARALAHLRFGTVHGPWIQGFVERSRRMEATLRERNVLAAADCARVRQLLLRQLVLEPGPANLRLLGADLLGREPVLVDTRLAAQLRDWRDAFHATARNLPLVPLPFRLAHEPIPLPHVAAVTTTLAIALSLAGGVSLAALVAIGLAYAHFRTPSTTTRTDNGIALATSILSLLAILITIPRIPEIVRRALNSPEAADWAILPLLGAGIVTALLATSLLWRAHPKATRSRRLAQSAMLTWVVLSLGLVLCLGRADAYRRDIERAGGRSRAELVRKVADPSAAGLIERLRAWHP